MESKLLFFVWRETSAFSPSPYNFSKVPNNPIGGKKRVSEWERYIRSTRHFRTSLKSPSSQENRRTETLPREREERRLKKKIKERKRSTAIRCRRCGSVRIVEKIVRRMFKHYLNFFFFRPIPSEILPTLLSRHVIHVWADGAKLERISASYQDGSSHIDVLVSL